MLGTRHLSDRRLVTLFSLVVASGLCVALEVVRQAKTGSAYYDFLVWNLFLAWIPFLFAIAVYDGHRRGASRFRLVALAAVWLVFFPNAPYIVTDFVHLQRAPSSSLLLDGLMIATFAATGLLLGFASLYLIQTVARQRVGVLACWLVVFFALGLGSLGILIGRIGRFNSWAVITRPGQLADWIAYKASLTVADPGRLALAVALMGVLSFAYLLLYSLVQAGIDLERPSRR